MRTISFYWILATCMILPTMSQARVTTLSGGVSTGYDFFERTYKNTDDSDEETTDGETATPAPIRDDKRSRLIVSPFITVVTETPRHNAEFTYQPTYWYDVEDNEDDIDHELSFDYERALAQRWDITFGDRFKETDEFNSYSPAVDAETGEVTSDRPGTDVETGENLSDDPGQRSYYTNSLRTGVEYTYSQDSSVAVDYSWNILRNDSGEEGSNYEDYDKHNIGVTVDHRFTSKWSATAEAGYIRGLYDSVSNGTTETTIVTTDPEGDIETVENIEVDANELADSDDVKEYRASLFVEHSLSVQHSVNFGYYFEQTDYDSGLRQDSSIHDFNLGWAWAVSPKTDFSISAGPTYLDSDGESGDWKYNGDMSLTSRFNRGTLGFSASTGVDYNNFTGTANERGVTEYWQFQANIDYMPLERMEVTAYAAYREEDQDEVADTEENQQLLAEAQSNGTASQPLATETITSKRYSAGLGCSYRLYEHYVVDLSYGYVLQESDNPNDEYDDHKVVLTLTYENDFFRW